jgi:hypothetical protein
MDGARHHRTNMYPKWLEESISKPLVAMLLGIQVFLAKSCILASTKTKLGLGVYVSLAV